MGYGCSKCCACDEEGKTEQKISKKDKTQNSKPKQGRNNLSEKEQRNLLHEFKSDDAKMAQVIRI